MKKFRVKDEHGEEYSVEEMIEEKTEDEDIAELTADEISALKKLASIADKLVELTSKDVADEEVEEKKEEIIEDEDEEIEDDDDDDIMEDDDDDISEEVVDTDEEIEEKEIVRDSKSSAASIKSKTKTKSHDAMDAQMSIAAAWAKRYGGEN